MLETFLLMLMNWHSELVLAGHLSRRKHERCLPRVRVARAPLPILLVHAEFRPALVNGRRIPGSVVPVALARFEGDIGRSRNI